MCKRWRANQIMGRPNKNLSVIFIGVKKKTKVERKRKIKGRTFQKKKMFILLLLLILIPTAIAYYDSIWGIISIISPYRTYYTNTTVPQHDSAVGDFFNFTDGQWYESGNSSSMGHFTVISFDIEFPSGQPIVRIRNTTASLGIGSGSDCSKISYTTGFVDVYLYSLTCIKISANDYAIINVTSMGYNYIAFNWGRNNYTSTTFPFWINNTLYPQPNTTTGLTNNQNFATKWLVNATGKGIYRVRVLSNTTNPNVADNTSSYIEIEITGKGIIPNTETVGEAFFVESGDSNPKSCTVLTAGQSCLFASQINATGAYGNYTIYFFSNGTNPNIVRNDSSSQIVEITQETATCNISLNYSNVEFNSIAHNTTNNPAQNNYSVSANTTSLCTGYLTWSIPNPILTYSIYTIANNNLKLNYTLNAQQNSTLNLRDANVIVTIGASAQSKVYPQYWLDVPNQQHTGDYQGQEVISCGC